MIQRHGWTLLFHERCVEQLQRLGAASDRAINADPKRASHNANVRLFRALSRLILEVVPGDPAREAYRQGSTLGPAHRHWRRAKFAQRLRLFFRYDSNARVIVFAWVNDEQSLRASGGKCDPYVVFRKMLERGNPPEDWEALLAAGLSGWPKRPTSRP